MVDTAIRARSSIGILAYGSLIADPGIEIGPLVVERLETFTPFPVEYARFSATRGGAPTVVPYSTGQPVTASVLVLAEQVSVVEARDLLWRRETRKERSRIAYRESQSANAVIVRDLPGLCGLAHVLYTDFNPAGKVGDVSPELLASGAIASVARSKAGEDGISYLIGLLEAGVDTALTSRYVAEILSRTRASDLAGALKQLRATASNDRGNEQD